jgi:serine/threonine protein kinase/tetratricopeptide (TPR) repeat protein
MDDPTRAPEETKVAHRSTASLAIGQMFGPRYRIIRMLGMGGMGAVYQAWDSVLDIVVALKVIRPQVMSEPLESRAVERRFKQELLLARQVTHKNVVRIHDLGEIDGIKYITMSYIDGADLATTLRRAGKLPVPTALRLMRQLAVGLQAAHEAGVVHRDLKPANIMIEGDTAVIMDFGIARSTSAPRLQAPPPKTTAAMPVRVVDVPQSTAAGAIVGTVAYMAPEQARGEAVDHRADIYAFGLIAADMLLGLETRGQTTLEELRRPTKPPRPPLHSVDPRIPEAIDTIVQRCTAADPADRYQTTAALVAALDRLDEQGVPLPAVRRLTPRLVAAIVVLATALTGLTYVVTRRASAPSVQPDPVSVVIADFDNRTGNPVFDRTLEPMLKLALEGAGFISAYDRSVIVRTLGVPAPDSLTAQEAQALAVKQGLGVVVAGAVERNGRGFEVSLRAIHAVTGNVLTDVSETASNENQVLAVTAALADAVREALGDDTPEADRRFVGETLSATSLDVVRDYAAAAQAMSDSRFEDALGHFGRAVQRDPSFGLAHAGMAIASRNLDRQQDAERYIKEAVSHLDGMTERERYRTRGLFYMITGDSEQCVTEFGDLVARYAADASARNNLALCLTYLRDLPRAVGEMQQVVKMLPRRALYRVNLALYGAYAGDFQTAEQEARAIENPGHFGLVALAFAQMGQGQLPQARATYETIGTLDALGGSYRASGLSDLAIYEGRFAEAVRTLSDGAAADLAAKDADRAANKYAALAYAEILRGRNAAAVAAAEKALETSSATKIRFLAARVFAEAGSTDRARSVAAGLAAGLEAEPRAYAKIVEGGIALRSGDARQAITALTEANMLLDTWIGRFDLGRAFLEAGAFTQADSEFDRCIRRRGETLALFLDEEPTYAYFPPVYYYQGRVREGLKSARFAESYRAYLAIRGTSTDDPLVADLRRLTAP